MTSLSTVWLITIGAGVGASIGMFLSISNPPPGMYIAMLGFLAVGISLRPEMFGAIGPRERAVWIMIAFSLVVLEIRVLYADQAKRDSDVTASRQLEVDRFQQIMIRFDQQQKLPELIQAANQRVAKLPAAQVSPRPVDKLKRDATLLSQEILQFLTDRVRGEPSLVPGGTDAEWKQNTESYLLYSRDTMSLYSQQFAARVIATRNAFAERGLTDKELDSIYEHPTNPIGIRMVGEHMGALAEKIH